jgi:hypothetical protein
MNSSFARQTGWRELYIIGTQGGAKIQMSRPVGV